MKNIHIIQTDKLSKLYVRNDVTPPFYSNFQGKPVNIYITNSEEIKEYDYFLNTLNNAVLTNLNIIDSKHLKKIILTTDKDLIKNGVQAIDDEFLEWFVKNPSCEEVEVISYLKDIINPLTNEKYPAVQHRHFDETKMIFRYHYRIIIPKEEPFKHKVETIPAEEILANRSNAYEFIDFDRQETKELNPYIGPFLLKNGFGKFKDNVYNNLECIITVLDDCYQIDFDHPEYGSVSAYTDSHSIMHLVGVLTWNDLIDKNYNK